MKTIFCYVMTAVWLLMSVFADGKIDAMAFLIISNIWLSVGIAKIGDKS